MAKMTSPLEILTLTNAGNVLPLMEDFYTIQGEGFFQGSAAYFIRLGGCNVGCHWCDVKDSWDFKKWPLTPVEKIAERALQFPGKIAVITGGEPTHYDLNALTNILKLSGLRTHIETSGTDPLTGSWDWVCLSPKKFKEPHPSIFEQADELKIIVFNESDFLWAKNLALKVRSHCRLFLQPEWSKKEVVSPSIINFIKNNPEWNLSVQIHKYLDIP